ncbi:hypothetical protein CKO18_08305 [Rhodoferax fermentans]|uniref:Uncharacterized protein n=2 Tax=Rhodoferax fermentans TaxID=28066 RepID=A0A1T1AQF5_RHOFE|nr:hypothetical protein [Rhodoferax fermentans]MBK1683582.1 hypothetical protein [Rhodoferax fermentans]OOV06324.1 hypothetical protein RF819_05910 [Rhodoferax fermentans]
MGFLAAINHVLNFLAPALWLALLLPVFARFVMGERAVARTLSWQIALHFVVGCGVLLAGLVLFGRDGKMLIYLALVLVLASTQCLLARR